MLAYASPAVFEYREYSVCGKNITEEEFAKYITTVNMACEMNGKKWKAPPYIV